MIRKLQIIAGLWLCSLAGLCAQDATPQLAQLKATIESALDIIYADGAGALSKDEKQAKVRAVLEENYDLTVIIRRAIGRNWNRLDQDQRERVVELVKQLVVKTFVDNMNGSDRPEVSFGEPIFVTEKRMEIPSRVVANGQPVSVLYRLGRLESGWQIYDVVAEDISVVSNYRQQIDDHFRRGNAEGLIERLEQLASKKELNEGEIKI